MRNYIFKKTHKRHRCIYFIIEIILPKYMEINALGYVLLNKKHEWLIKASSLAKPESRYNRPPCASAGYSFRVPVGSPCLIALNLVRHPALHELFYLLESDSIYYDYVI